MRLTKGFSTIELMIVVVIASILAGFAINSYQGYVRKSYRSEAIQTLLSMQLTEERFRSSNTTYGGLTQVMGSTTATPSGRYNLSIFNNTATTYTLRASATGNQTNDAVDSTSCSTLEIIVNGAAETKTPAACWQS